MTTINTTIRIPMSVFERQQHAQSFKSIDLRSLTSPEDLTALKKEDPFLYHSIPSVHKATLAFKTVDHSKLIVDFPSEPRRHGSTSRGMNDVLDEPRRRSRRTTRSSGDDDVIVTRKTKLTTELHYSAALDDLLGMDKEEFNAQCRELGIDVDGFVDDLSFVVGPTTK